MNNEIIRIEHLKKSYKDGTPIEDISTVINRGEVISIIGPSGTGKSTFIRCINLLERPTSGKIFIDGEEITAPNADVTKIRRKMGMVFQSFNLFPLMSVVENIMMAPIDQLKLSTQESYERAMNLLESVGMKEKAYAYPSSLSGGQKQRVAIARALAMEPDVLLLDEPTSALDPERVQEVKSVISNLTDKGITVLLVTHEMSFAKSISTRILYLDEGGIYEEGTPEEIFEHPKKEKTKRFINQMHCCSFDVLSSSFDYYDALGMVDSLCLDNRVSKSIQNKASIIIEEIIANMIIPGLAKDSSIIPDYHFELECGRYGKLIIDLICSKKSYSVFEEKDQLSAQLIKSIASDIEIKEENGNYKLSFVVK